MCNQFESITTEVKEPDSQEASTKLSIETREHGQEHSQTHACAKRNDHRCSYAIGMQLCLLCNSIVMNLANTVI